MATSTAPRRAPRRLLLGLATAALGALAAAAALEVLLRIADPLHHREQLEREAFGRAVLGQREDGSIRLVPGSAGTLFGHEHAIGAQGFRTPAFARERAPGTWRLVVLGDSVAFGWGVAAAEAFPRLAEGALQARLDGGDGPAGFQRVEVVNLSTPGWGVPHYLRCTDELAAGLDAQLVVVTLINNDFTDVVEALRGPSATPEAPVAPLPRSYLRHALGRVAAAWSGGSERGDYQRDADFWRDIAAVATEARLAEDHLCRAFEQLHARLGPGPRLAVMDTVTDGAARRLEHFATCLAERRIARFEAWLPTEDFAARFAVGATDAHPNAAGHRILAEVLVDWIIGHPPWREP